MPGAISRRRTSRPWSRPAAAPAARRRCCPIPPCSARRCGRAVGRAVRARFAGSSSRAMLALAPEARPVARRPSTSRRSSRPRAAKARASRCMRGLRAAGADAADQRGDDPAADAARLRGRGRRRAAAAAARSPIISGRRTRDFAQARISTPGRARSANGGLDAVVINASGCGTTVKEYGFMFRADPAYAEKAATVSRADARTSPSS